MIFGIRERKLKEKDKKLLLTFLLSQHVGGMDVFLQQMFSTFFVPSHSSWPSEQTWCSCVPVFLIGAQLSFANFESPSNSPEREIPTGFQFMLCRSNVTALCTYTQPQHHETHFRREARLSLSFSEGVTSWAQLINQNITFWILFWMQRQNYQGIEKMFCRKRNNCVTWQPVRNHQDAENNSKEQLCPCCGSHLLQKSTFKCQKGGNRKKFWAHFQGGFVSFLGPELLSGLAKCFRFHFVRCFTD